MGFSWSDAVGFTGLEDAWDFVDQNVLGGASKDAAKQQAAALGQSLEEVRAGKNRARDDIMRLFPQAQDTAMTGFQNASQLLAGTLPQQMDMYNQGNMNAQQTMLAGAPQYQNAILGGPIDYSAFQPKQAQFDNQAYQSLIPDIYSPNQTHQMEMDRIQQGGMLPPDARNDIKQQQYNQAIGMADWMRGLAGQQPVQRAPINGLDFGQANWSKF